MIVPFETIPEFALNNIYERRRDRHELKKQVKVSEISKKLTDDERKQWKEEGSLSAVHEISSIDEVSELQMSKGPFTQIATTSALRISKPLNDIQDEKDGDSDQPDGEIFSESVSRGPQPKSEVKFSKPLHQMHDEKHADSDQPEEIFSSSISDFKDPTEMSETDVNSIRMQFPEF